MWVASWLMAPTRWGASSATDSLADRRASARSCQRTRNRREATASSAKHQVYRQRVSDGYVVGIVALKSRRCARVSQTFRNRVLAHAEPRSNVAQTEPIGAQTGDLVDVIMPRSAPAIAAKLASVVTESWNQTVGWLQALDGLRWAMAA